MKHMKNLMQKAHKGEGGFTLVELLIVILILGAIATVVILNIGGFFGMGECEGYCTEKYNLQSAIIAFMAASNTSDAPGDLSDLDPYFMGGSGSLKFTWAGCWDTTTGEVTTDTSDHPDGDCPCDSP